MMRFDHTVGAFVPVLRNRVVTPDGYPGGNLFQDEDFSVVFDDQGEWLDLEEGGPGHINVPFAHDCRGERGGAMTIKSPEYFLRVTNPTSDEIIQDLFEDETGSVVVDDLLETLILNF